MRSLRFTLFTLALLLPAAAPAQATPNSIPSVSSKQHLADLPEPTAPAFPIEIVALGAALATAKKTRRSSGKRGDVAMILDSRVHVMRENKKGDPELTEIKGGVLVDDTDLSDDEIDELTARKAIRPAKPEEIERLEQGDVARERDTLVGEQEAEIAELQAKQAAERVKLGDDASASKIAKLKEKQADEVAKLQAKHAKALNALAE